MNQRASLLKLRADLFEARNDVFDQIMHTRPDAYALAEELADIGMHLNAALRKIADVLERVPD